MASGAHDLVLRDLYPGAIRPRVPGIRSRFPLSVQFLLRGGGAAASAAAAWAAFAALLRRCRRVPRACRGGDDDADRRRVGGGMGGGSAAHRAWSAPRAATSGADPDGHQARFLD